MTIDHYLTARDTGDRLSSKKTEDLCPAKNCVDSSVSVFPDILFQTWEGFGGAWTEATADALSRVSPENRSRALRAYFDPKEGFGYDLCRTHMNSCDFALGNYACCDQPGDSGLTSFSLERESKLLLPLIQDSLAIRGEPVKLFISPWSPPAWMKDNGEMNHGGKLREECRTAWAAYYVRFIRELEARSIPVWGLTVQNEPAARQVWDSCLYSAEEEAAFVREHLGPALAAAGYGHLKLMIWDHNRDELVRRIHPAYTDPATAQFLWGAAFHWYGDLKHSNLQLAHDAWPDKKLLASEGCQEGGPHIGAWETGERYGKNIMRDINNWTVGWCDWNLVLDETGGPNHVGNLCSAPILADTENDRLLFQSSYYYIGHFARWIRPGARRALCTTTRDAVEATAFLNQDGSLVTVVLNLTDIEQSYNLVRQPGEAGVPVCLPPHSIVTHVAAPEA